MCCGRLPNGSCGRMPRPGGDEETGAPPEENQNPPLREPSWGVSCRRKSPAAAKGHGRNRMLTLHAKLAGKPSRKSKLRRDDRAAPCRPGTGSRYTTGRTTRTADLQITGKPANHPGREKLAARCEGRAGRSASECARRKLGSPLGCTRQREQTGKPGWHPRARVRYSPKV